MFSISVGLLIFNGLLCSFSQNLDFAKYIPEDDLKAVQSGSFKSAVAQADLPDYYQADLVGCIVSARPPCPLQMSAPAYFKLPNGTVLIPYIVEPEVDESLLDPIVSALDAMAGQVGCIQFISADDAPSRHVPSTPVIRFVHGDSCAGEFGGVKSPAHKVYVDGKCMSASGEKGSIQRLVLLAMGFPHEHVRNDRDQYIIINYYNVIPERTWEFEKYDKGIFDTLPYDYDSLLHPGYVFLAQRTKTPTIMAKNKARLGQNAQLSAGDVTKVRSAVCQVLPGPAEVQPPAKTPVDQAPPAPTPTPTPTPTKKPATNVDIPDVIPIKAVATTPAADATDNVQASISLPVTRCSLRQLVFLENTQTISRTLVYPTKRRKQHSTRESTWWYAQDLATTKDYLGQSVDYPEFAGAVKTVAIKTAELATRILETEYEPSVMEDGATRLQTKFETRIVRCQDRERSLP